MIDTISFLMNNLNAVEVFAASSSQSQGNGTVRPGITRVNTVGTNDDALTLPDCVKDTDVILINADNAQNAQLWANTDDRIDGGSIDGNIRLWAGQTRWLKAFDDTDWRTIYKANGHAPSVTAFAGGGQGSATLLEAEVSRVSVIATDDDSVVLPLAFPGLFRQVHNDDSVNDLALFPGVGDAINDSGVNAAISLPPDSSIQLFCVTNARWNGVITYGGDSVVVGDQIIGGHLSLGDATITPVSPLHIIADGDTSEVVARFRNASNANRLLVQIDSSGNGYITIHDSAGAITTTIRSSTGQSELSGGLRLNGSLKQSVSDGVTASATQTQAGATYLGNENDLTEVLTVGTTGDAVRIPGAVAGQSRTVRNASANSMQVFPTSSDTIDGGAVVSVAAGVTQVFNCFVVTEWRT